MRKLAMLVILANFHNFAMAGGEMKKVCHEDPKTKKEVCKTIKVHKKLDGTKVPPK